MFVGLAGLSLPGLAACGGTPPTGATFDRAASTSRHSVPGLDAVIDISHNVTVTDFAAVRRSNILAVIHKVTEGGDWFDPSYATRRRQAEAAGLLWGGYHFGTRQYSGAEQANAFLSACQPGPATVMALDLEPNERKPANTMRLAQAEEFVLTIQREGKVWSLRQTTSARWLWASTRAKSTPGCANKVCSMFKAQLAQCMPKMATWDAHVSSASVGDPPGAAVWRPNKGH